MKIKVGSQNVFSILYFKICKSEYWKLAGWMVLKELQSINIYFEIKNNLEEEKDCTEKWVLFNQVTCTSSNIHYLHLFMAWKCFYIFSIPLLLFLYLKWWIEIISAKADEIGSNGFSKRDLEFFLEFCCSYELLLLQLSRVFDWPLLSFLKLFSSG